MELVKDHIDRFFDWNTATGEQLKNWIENNGEKIKMIHALANSEPVHTMYYTYQDFSAWGGNDTVVINITASKNSIELEVADSEKHRSQYTINM